jgi:hypothetical protein
MEVQKVQGAPSQLEAVQALRTKVTDLINQAKSGDVQKVDLSTLDGWLDQAAAQVMGGDAKKGDFNGVQFGAMNKAAFDPMKAMQMLQTVDRQLARVELKLEDAKGGGAEPVDAKTLQNWLDDALLETIPVPGFEGKTQTADNDIRLSPSPGDDIIRVVPSKVKSIDLPAGGTMDVKTTPEGSYLTASTGDMFFVPPGRDLPKITCAGSPYTPTHAK